MASVEIGHLGAMRFVVRTREVEVVVDRAPDEGGTGPGFRSAELLLGALGTCTVGGIVLFAQNTGIDLGSLTAKVTAQQAEHPKRLESIDVDVRTGHRLDERQRASLERVGNRCKIHNTLTSSPSVALRLLNS